MENPGFGLYFMLNVEWQESSQLELHGKLLFVVTDMDNGCIYQYRSRIAW